MPVNFDTLLDEAGRVILGKHQQLRLALACVLARGHLLIEDIPGVGKTTLALVLARVLGLSFRRVQLTSDLLPSDILGAAVFDRTRGDFDFRPGPIFTQVLLADEINRATPRTQSALLEAMEERQVTIEGRTHPLPEPFFVIATQNPAEFIGTYPLPESQLDRFLMRIDMGYPTRDAERALLQGKDRRELLAALQPVIGREDLLDVQERVPGVLASEALLDYIQTLLETSRSSPDYRIGLSPRAGLAVLRSAQAWALLEGRDFVLPEDVQAILPSVVGHRLAAGAPDRLVEDDPLAPLIAVPVP